MLCEICGRRQAINSRVVNRGFGEEKVAVCIECAKTESVNDSHIDFSMDFWGESRKITKCAVCGSSIESILSSGYVGCATCYQIFAREISELTNSIQGKNIHVGKVPLTIINKIDEEADVASMMNKALKTGDYSVADRVRDYFPRRRL